MARTLGVTTSVPLRGRLVTAKDEPDLRASTPIRDASQKEIPNAAIEAVVLGKSGEDRLSLGRTQCDEQGYLDTAFAADAGALEPGIHTIEIRFQGKSAGRTEARLLDAGHTGIVVRSDVDLTYLDTHFTRKRDLLRLLAQRAAERTTLPAMEQVYQALRAGASGSEDRPLVFISGSPRFFKRVLSARMEMDGVAQDGILLKPFDDIAKARMIALDIDSLAAALKEQVAYKLVHLMNGRRELPKGAKEILLGDDSESDFITYAIYHRFTSGQIDLAGFDKELDRAGVPAADRSAASAVAAKLRQELGTFPAVQAIYINLTGTPNASHAVNDWAIPGISRHHAGAWPLILDLFEEGLVSKGAVSTVRARLLALGKTDTELGASARAAVTSGLLKAATTVGPY